MRAIVVGGLGFLGGAVVDALLARGDDVGVVDPVGDPARVTERFGAGRVVVHRGDILEPASLDAAFAGADEVYHFAGRLGTSELDDDVPGAVAANVTGTVHVFERALAAEVPAVFHASKPHVWLNTYTITKFAAEEFGRLYAANNSLRVRTLRFFNAYGPRQALGPVRKIVPTFIRQALRGEPLTVYGDGEQTVDMIHSSDIGRISVDYLRTAASHEPVDCGRGVEMSVNAVARAVNRIVGNAAGIAYRPMRRGETPRTRLVADIAPLRAAVGDLVFADWEQSLYATVAWYRAEPGITDDGTTPA